MSRVFLLAVIFCCLHPSPVRAQWSQGLRTGRSHVVAVSSSPTAGLEAAMPRTGPYAKGISLDLKSKWAESERAYAAAANEFRNLLSRRPQWRETIHGWIAKAEFQQEQSRKLRQQAYYGRNRWRHHYVSAHTHYYQAVAKHNKWLGIRAFTGRALKPLFDSAVSDYRSALKRRPQYTLARLALAALYHEAGNPDTGRRIFNKVMNNPSRWMAIQVAYYHTAAGEIDKAFEKLDEAVRYSSSVRRHIYRSNDFDRLRTHPRFRRVLGNYRYGR